MALFYALHEIDQAPLSEVGETAWALRAAQRAGIPVLPTWVISAQGFDQMRTGLVTREPAFAEWPQVLWQADLPKGYAAQRLSQRLMRPLLNALLSLPMEPMLAAIATPIVRVMPSLWLGEGEPTAIVAQLLGDRTCWATTPAVELAIKQLWAELFTAQSLVYWKQRSCPSSTSGHAALPTAVQFAVLVQAVQPVTASGTLKLRHNQVSVEAVRGLPQARMEAVPDQVCSPLSALSDWRWQRGQQEQSYQPADGSPQESDLDPCLTVATITDTARPVLGDRATLALRDFATALSRSMPQPFWVEWQLPMGAAAQFHLAQAGVWPLQPAQAIAVRSMQPATDSRLWGRGASPGQAIASAWVIRPGEDLPRSVHHHIIVAPAVMPDWLPVLKTASGIVTEQGGFTSHGALLARELGLPAIVGVQSATALIQTGDRLHLDGDRGWIERLSERPDADAIAIAAPGPRPTTALPPRTLWVNLSQADQATQAATLPVAGVGLLRSEWLLLPCLDNRHPYHWLDQGQGQQLHDRLVEQLRPILMAFAPRPVRYRSLDLRSHEMARLTGSPAVEQNPMLGLRGTLSYQHRPDLFQLELAALCHLQREGLTNLQLLLPFVRTVEEFRECRAMVVDSGLYHCPEFRLMIMAEVPSVLFLLADYVAAGVQGMAIGSNDLTQLILGIDREHPALGAIYDERHPAVRAAIASLLGQARSLNLPMSLCGLSAAQHPEWLHDLFVQGLEAISVDMAAVNAVYNAMIQPSRP